MQIDDYELPPGSKAAPQHDISLMALPGRTLETLEMLDSDCINGSVLLQLGAIGSERKISVLAAVLIDEADADSVVTVSQPAVNLPDMRFD